MSKRAAIAICRHLVRLGVRRYEPSDLVRWPAWRLTAALVWIRTETATREGRGRP